MSIEKKLIKRDSEQKKKENQTKNQTEIKAGDKKKQHKSYTIN